MNEYLKSIGIEAKNIDLYHTAFTHKSYGNENEVENNERLEFLGDAVLEVLVTEFLFKTFPKAREGKMTAIRSSVVRKGSLAQLGKKIGIGEHIKLSKGERFGNKKDYILANTVESLLGALYLDRGIMQCKKFLKHYLFPEIILLEKEANYIGPKSKFQEWAQKERNITPHYQLVSAKGPDHFKTFTMAVYLGEECIAEGIGNSKQMAENNSAENALQKLVS